MPTRPPSHSQLLGRQEADRAYNQTRRRLDPALAAAQQIRNSARWQKVRKLQLSRHPLCADPDGYHQASGQVEPATQVDHIIPLVERPDLAFDLEALQSLCTACHGRKSARERTGAGLPRAGGCESQGASAATA